MSQALTIFKQSFFNLPDVVEPLFEIPVMRQSRDMFKLRAELSDRSYCETCTDLLQLIPYILLVDENTGKLFVYSRGIGGKEERLHGKVSIGLGGHIEEEPNARRTLSDTIVNAAIREIKEEVGYDLTPEDIQSLRVILPTSPLLYDNSNEVGRVHLGIAMRIFVDMDVINDFEHDVITKGKWMTMTEIDEAVLAKEIIFEEWSRMAYFWHESSLHHSLVS